MPKSIRRKSSVGNIQMSPFGVGFYSSDFVPNLFKGFGINGGNYLYITDIN